MSVTLSVFPSAPVRPRIPGSVARRIDRLSRGAHAFHRFAHHPLCGRYASELVVLGRRTRVCRGCLAALSGVASGIGLGALMALMRGQLPWLALPLLALAVAGVGIRRGPKILKRFVPALALCTVAVAGPWLASVAALAVAGLLLSLYRQRGPNRAPCTTCPERSLEVCSGFRPIVARERALQRRVRPWLASAGAARQARPIDTRLPRPL